MWQKHSRRRTRPTRRHTGEGSRNATLSPAHPTGALMTSRLCPTQKRPETGAAGPVPRGSRHKYASLAEWG